MTTKAPMALARRVMLLLGLVVLGCAAILATLLQRSIERHFIELDAGDLQLAAQAMVHQWPQQPHPSAGEHGMHQHSALSAAGHHQRFSEIRAPSGELLQTAAGADLRPLWQQARPVDQITPAALFQWQQADGADSFRGAVLQLPDGRQVAVAMALAFHQRYLDQLLLTLWLTIGLAALLILLAAWWGIRQGLQPLARLSSQIADISTARLQQRLDPAQVPAELTQLVHSFNQMLQGLQQSFDRLSEFSADIAHELRTPLSNLITQTQVSLSQPRSLQEYRELLYSNLEEQERLARMVNDMLWLAKTDHGLIRLDPKPVDLAALCQQLFDFFELLADEKNVRLQFQGPPGASLTADKVMLQRALSNLLSNAIRHADPGSVVQVDVQSQPEQLTLKVCNQGPDIAPEHLPRLFERFYRADPSRQRHSEGAGLGLALVRSIVQLHEGQISASSASGTTCFQLTFHREMPLDKF